MRKIYLFDLLLVLALCVSSNYSFSQTANDSTKTSAVSDTAHITGEVGKIYTKAEADSLYGPILTIDTIKTEDLSKFAENSPKYMMFNLIEGKAYVLNASREVISGPSLVVGKPQSVEPTKAFKLFSTGKILELIKQGGSDVTTVEIRSNVLTLTNGSSVLEKSSTCPPICP
jgi:hypothetical protein